MSPSVALLLDYCQRVLRAEQGLITQLTAAGFVCSAANWQFSLPALQQFLLSQMPAEQAADYPQFVQQLYASDLNQRLRELRAEMALSDNQGKVHPNRKGLNTLRRKMTGKTHPRALRTARQSDKSRVKKSPAHGWA
jgi:hypothetical protein